MTERILSQVQAAETGFLRRVNGVTLRTLAYHTSEIKESEVVFITNNTSEQRIMQCNG